MKKTKLLLSYAIGSMLLVGCTSSNTKEESVKEEVLEENIEELKEKEKQEKINEAISKYVEGENPLYIDGILIVNKDYSIPKDFANKLDEEVQAKFELMKEAAEEDGLVLSIRSGFRSHETQSMLYNNYVARDGVEKASRYSAKPGHSEHETGLAIDISNGDPNKSIGDWFTDTPQAKWLYENAHKYGFILRYPEGKEDITGYKYESWHYRYVGTEHSQYFNQNNLTLEEYLGIKKTL